MTVSVVKNSIHGSEHVVYADVVVGEYAAGGVSLTAQDFGYSDALRILYLGAHPADGYLADYDPADAKLYVFEGPDTEVADQTELNTPFRVFAVIGS